MRGFATWLLVAAVAAIGVVAGVDALRGGERTRAEPRPAAPSRGESTTAPASAEAAVSAALREAGIGGVLEFIDEDCAAYAVSLPDLAARPSRALGDCTFDTTNATAGYAVDCSGGQVSIDDPQQAPYAQVRADCPPAWKLDGTPTLLRDGSVVEPHPCPDRGIVPMRCTRALLSGDDLVRELRGAGWAGFRFAVEELLWLSDSRAAAIVTARSRDDRGDLLVVFDSRRLVTAPTAAYEDLTALRLSPSGGFVVAQIADPGGVVVVDRDGAPVRPLVRHGSALAWSPDEHWIAEATEDGVYIFPADDRTPEVYVLPIVARDLVWR